MGVLTEMWNTFIYQRVFHTNSACVNVPKRTADRVHTLLSILFLCSCFLSASAQVTIPVTYLPFEGKAAVITPDVLILKEKGHLFNKQNAWESLQKGAFEPFSDFESPGKFEIGQYQFWVAFVLENRSADTLDLLVNIISHEDTIWRQKNGVFSVEASLLKWFPASLEKPLLPYKIKEIDCIQLDPHQRDTFFGVINHYKTSSSLLPRIFSPDDYESYLLAQTKYSNLFYFLFVGALGTMMLFSFAQFIQLGDRTFLWYALYLASLLFVTWRNIEDDNPWLYSTYYFVPWTWTKVFQSVAHFCFYTLFAAHFLKKGRESPDFMRYVLRFVLGFSLVCCLFEVALMLLDRQYESWLLYFVYRTIMTVFSFFFLWLLWRKGGALAKIIFIGTLCAVLGEFISLFLSAPWSTLAGSTGTVLELAFFSLGLAYRSRLFRNEHDRLQIRHIKQLEENERLREIERREEVEAFKNHFYANITHEFRTPLTVLLGMAELLHKNPDPEARKASLIMERNGQNLLRLVNQLLHLSKVESGAALQLHPIHANVMQFVKVTVESFDSLAVIKNQNLSVQTVPAELLMDFDPDRLQQILSNLVGNALKFTPESGEISVSCSVIAGSETAESDMLQIEVRDNGIGIPEDALPHIFDRFYRSENSEALQKEGNGIGLALVNELLILMQGKMEVESRIGEGSVFRVWIPVLKDGLLMMDPGDINTQTIRTEVDSSFDKPVLLLVEDNEDLIEYLLLLLRHDYQMLTAVNGREGLAQAFEHLPDIVLSDVMMPGMDGFEFCQTLKNDQRTSHIPVVMLTARAMVADKIGGLQHGADAWLTKPFHRAELFTTLEAVLASRRRLRAYYENKNEMAPSVEIAQLVQKENEFLGRVKAFVDTHLDDEHYDIAQLCRDLSMSRMQLHRKLTALGAPSAALFVRAHRLRHALTMLKETDLSVSEIAFRTGFSDPAYFSRCFRETFGVAPSAWRNG